LKKDEGIDNKLNLKISKYKSSKGEEYFLEFVNKDNILFGLCRLRIVDSFAIVRELHVYGQALALGEKGKKFGQHIGLGKKLIKEVEKIIMSKPFFSKKGGDKKFRLLRIISGVGVRQYYKGLGYKLDKDGIYMEKKL